MERESFLEEGEEVLVKVRKHNIVYLGDILVHVFGCVMFMVIAWFFSKNGGVSGSYLSLFFVLLVMLSWLSFFYGWTKDYFDVWYVTDRHIIAVNQKELLEREEAFMEFERIQDVFFEKDGFLQTFLGYGKLRVQSAGNDQEFVFCNVSDVENIAHTIMKMRDAVKVSHV